MYKLTKKQLDHWSCQDCRKSCLDTDYDYYMVKDHIWELHGVGDEMLCIECLQKRIGRDLVYKDFTDCPLNEKNPFVQKLKLNDETGNYFMEV